MKFYRRFRISEDSVIVVKLRLRRRFKVAVWVEAY